MRLIACVAGAWFLALSSSGRLAAEAVERITVFQAGEGNYHTYRIPSLIRTAKGTLLAFCEGRKSGRGDAGNIDLVLRRSVDSGRTWQPMQVVWDDGLNTCGNPCPVIDESTGKVWLLLTKNLGGDSERDIVEGKSRESRTVWVSHSGDDGISWTAPIEITRHVKQPDWTWYATGPGIGIQLKSGRLMIPCDNKVAGTKANQSHVIYRDDHGATWKLGGVAGPKCNESQVIEREDGTLVLNMRSFQADNFRFVSTSSDGGLSWSKPAQDATLIEPVCQASMIRIPSAESKILFSNPASKKRENLTVRLSLDDARSWPKSRVLHAGPAAYSCLTVMPNGLIGCLYEHGDKSPYEAITFARFSIDWLESDDPN